MDIKYTIVRSPRRRKLTITVERDRTVVVHAPEATSDEMIRQVVDSKRQWISERTGHPQKYRPLPHPPGKEMVSGESALYLGRRFRIELTNTEQTTVELDQHFLISKTCAADARQALREWYFHEAEAKITPRVERRAAELGVAYADARIVDNLRSWGSCTPKNSILLNWRLIKAPMFVIDYVIVHELAHLIEANHTPRFWNILRAQAPTMEKAKEWLKEYGQLLEEEI